MFACGCDNMFTGMDSAMNGNVQGFRGIACKSNAGWVRCAKECSQFFAGIINKPGGVQGRGMSASTGIADGIKRAEDGFCHLRRL